jgi:YVTN family beta-propeller protein
LAVAAVMVLAACSGTSSSQTVTAVPHVVGMVAVGGMPHFPAVDPGTNRLFVSSLKSASLATVNLSSGQTTTAIPVGMTPHTVMFEQGAERVWVTDLGSDQVSVVDARTMQAAGTVTVGKLPHGLAIDPGHHRAYVTNVADSTVSVIDTTSLAVIQTFVLPEFDGRKAWPWGVSLDAKGGRLYVTATGQLPKPDGTLTSSGSDRLDVLDLNDGHLLSSVVVGAGPWNVAVEENTGTAFVGVTSTNELVAVKGDRVVGRVKVGDNPHGVVIDPAANRLYVNNAKSNSVSVIDTRGLKVVATVGVGQQPQGIALDSRRHLLYTANQAAGTITVVGLTGGRATTSP